MKRKITLFIAAAALSGAALVAAALGDTSSAAPPRASRGALVALGKTALGKVLVDARGRTLYLFEKDKRGMSSCYGACATAWPPLIASGKPLAKPGIRASLLGRVKRRDGRWQVTYNRHPLYTFVQDGRKGQTSGEGVDAFGAEWYAVSPAGAKIEQSEGSRGDDPSSGGYGGYGY
jgi:predicted lipoprotein with Yx(FWY)xxD motif